MLGGARVLEANRSQLSWDLVDLEALLSEEHRARLVWRFVETLDLTRFYAVIRSREGEAGRPAADPKVLLALWLYANPGRGRIGARVEPLLYSAAFFWP
jgi:transposase